MKNMGKASFWAVILTFAAGAYAQGDTASVPFSVNVEAYVRAEQSGKADVTAVTANKQATLKIPLGTTIGIASERGARGRLSVPTVTASRGNISLKLPAQSYQNADISLYSVNGRRVLRCKAVASGAAASAARRNVAAGAYLLSARGAGGASFSTRLTHGGGRLNVSAAFGTASSLTNETAVAPENWAIRVSAAGYGDSVYTLSAASGANPLQTITLRAATGFAPEMLGLTPGATAASVNLNWISTNTAATGGDKAFVRLYGPDGELIKTDTGKAANATTGKRHHKAVITGLTPNTNYKYSVSGNGNEWSYKYNYKTPPSGNVFTIAVIADPQITDGNQDSDTEPKSDPATVAQGWKDIVQRIAATSASMIVSAGDQVDDARNYKESQYVNFFAPDALRSLPLSPVIGNHDLHTQFFNHFNMPNSASSPNTSPQSYDVYSGGGNYYYLYNNILFVVFNTGTNASSQENADSYVARYKTAMTAAKAAHAGAYDWLIVQHHKSTTSISSHASDLELEYYIKAGLEKLITDEGVDVVITGHDHIHVRSHLMIWDNAKGYSVRSADNNGAIYLTFSTASAVKFYPALFILDPANNEYVDDYTTEYPVLVDGTRGWEEFGKVRGQIGSYYGTINPDKIPLSVAFYVRGQTAYDLPNYAPNYTIFEVNGKTINVKTYAVDNSVVDEYVLTPRGVR